LTHNNHHARSLSGIMARGTSRLGIGRADCGSTRVLDARIVPFPLLLLAVMVPMLMLMVAGCSGTSATRPEQPTPGLKAPCKLDAGARAPAREYLEIETCPAHESERVKGDSR